MRTSLLLLPAVLAATGCGHAGAAAAPAPERITVTAPPLVEGPPPPAAPPAPGSPVAAACGLDLARLLGDELALRPEAGPADLYKLLHQAILGPGHVLANPVPARQALARELAQAGPPRRDEPIVEDLDERQGTVRVNLRRWKFIRATADELWPIVEASARAIGSGDRERLAACLEAAAPALEARGTDASAFRAFAAERAGEGFPAVSHGEAYREAYAPSYRVVLRRFLPPWVTAPPPEAG